MLREALARPYHSGRKVFIIKDAEDMTVEASNALLKVLEEPPAYVTFVLTAANVRSIPETIISRCQTLPFRKLPSDVLKEILLKYHGLTGEEAETAALYADGSVDRALWIAGRSKEGGAKESVLDDIVRGSPAELAQKYAKIEPLRRVDVLIDLEVELTRRLRTQAVLQSDDGASGREAEREVRRSYRAIRSLQMARERLRCNVNPFLTFSVLFMDLAQSRREGE
jgi:DNA polymerase III delta prime subunit